MSKHICASVAKWAAPYARLARIDKPVGTYLLLAPTLWGTALATAPGALPALSTFALFATGAFVMRGAGCTINDMWDRDFDAKVERTKSRPIASGEVSMRRAWTFLAAQLSAGLAVLVQLPPVAIAVGAASMPLVVLYPLAKRVTYLPQFVLGLTFNWGVFVGYSTVTGGSIGWETVPLYVGGLFWTLLYDTIYAHQDKRDDRLVGVKSSALLLERLGISRSGLYGFAAAMVSCWTLAGYMSDASWIYYASVSGSAAHAAWQIGTVNFDSREDCMRKFVSNQWIGWLLLGGIVFDRWSRPVADEQVSPDALGLAARKDGTK